MNFVERYVTRQRIRRTDAMLAKMLDQYSIDTAKLVHSYRKKIDEQDGKALKLKGMCDDFSMGNIVLNVKEAKIDTRKWYWKAYDYITGSNAKEKISGHVLYFDKNMNMKFFNIMDKDVDNLFKIRRKGMEGEAYLLHNYFGQFHGKRMFMAKFPYAISLDLLQETEEVDAEASGVAGQQLPQLAYDSKAYYNLLEHTVKRNITRGEEPAGMGITRLFKEYWIYILVLIALAYLMFTPQGKELLQNILGQLNV